MCLYCFVSGSLSEKRYSNAKGFSNGTSDRLLDDPLLNLLCVVLVP